MRYLMIHWIDEAVLAESAAIESGVEAWTAEMDRRGVRLQGEPLRSVSEAAAEAVEIASRHPTAGSARSSYGRSGTAWDSDDARSRPARWQLPQGREGGLVTDDEYQPVAVSRRICAPAHDIFQVLANPVRHPEFDGSQMLRGAGSTTAISAAGDVFVMKMHYSQIGDYEMNNHVVEYEQDRRIGWEPEAGRGHPDYDPGSSAPARWGHRWSYQLTPDGPDATIVTEIYDCSAAPEHERVAINNGKIWAEDMAKTLERLDALCARQGNQPSPA